ncbi:VOC family protein [Halodesulfovibrio spirochaetisodalis]|uniref:VOC domain-containing protein n=1 Tax=Halodesulfovibrio spirochaetisodalis TaxID=1560234 RepID=A0A1B7X9I9_9BACT|nr:VOC family protein [Halodesulfovibrio spirochaetisodalis]OBQ46002.1 hypothetical protein SP90_15020 [Halodesulfovibrio spirochaetisodalis]
MQGSSREHGVFSFNELITSDLESAKKFYGELFGWEFRETETIYGNLYLVAMKGDKVVAGMMLREGNVPDDVPLIWDQYVTVDDVDASARKVLEIGGKVMLPPTDIEGVGRFCVVLDPQGVGLNLITYV